MKLFVAMLLPMYRSTMDSPHEACAPSVFDVVASIITCGYFGLGKFHAPVGGVTRKGE